MLLLLSRRCILCNRYGRTLLCTIVVVTGLVLLVLFDLGTNALWRVRPCVVLSRLWLVFYNRNRLNCGDI